MTILLGATLAAGVLLTLSPWLWPTGERSTSTPHRGRLVRLAGEAGFPSLQTRSLVIGIAGAALGAASLVWLVTASAALAALAGIAGGTAPIAYLRGRRLRLRRLRRQLWPDVCDLLIAAIRVGLSLPDAVATLAESAPRRSAPHSACSPETCGAADGSTRVSTG